MLNDTRVRNVKTRDRAFKLYDERGLFLLVTPAGGRLWRFKYHLHDQEKLISLGAYPDVTLKRAREKRDAARRLVADGIDPSVQRKAERAALAQSFEAVAKEWLELQSKSLAPETLSILGSRLNSALYPYIGNRPISAITVAGAPDYPSPHRSTQARSQLAEGLRHLSIGRITNDEFEDRYGRAAIRSADPGVRAVFWQGAWMLYSDLEKVRFAGQRRLPRESRRHIARWIMFLKTDRPYEWPLPSWWTNLA